MEQEPARAETEAVFRFFPVAKPLGDFVEYVYSSTVPAGFMTRFAGARLPEAEAQLVFAIEEGAAFPGSLQLPDGTRAALFLQPGHLHVITIPSSIRHATGASLRPAGLRALTGDVAPDLFGTDRVALEDIWGAPGRELLERLLVTSSAEARVKLLADTLRERLCAGACPSPLAVRAFELIRIAHGELTVAELARRCGCSTRTLYNAIARETGLTPKALARIARMRRALELLKAGKAPSSAAVEAAFSDQAHMSREFLALVGEPPARVGRLLRHSAQALPEHTSERELTGTGLLVLSRDAAVTAPVGRQLSDLFKTGSPGPR